MDQCMIELTNNCSFACAFCIHPHMKRPRGYMDFDLFRRIVDDVVEHDLAKQLNFSGLGEPMLHPRFFDFADYAAKAGLRTNVITNCSLLSPQTNQRLVDSGITQMLLSLQSPNAESYRLRRAKKPDYETYLANIRGLVARRLKAGRGPSLMVSYLITKYNWVLKVAPELSHFRMVDSFSEMRDLVNAWITLAAESRGEKPELFGWLGAVAGYVASNQPLFRITPEFSVLFVDLHFWWHDEMLPERLHVKRMQYGVCPLPGTFVVWWDGRTHFCCHGVDIASDDVRERPLHEIWTSDRQVTLMDALARGELIDPLCQQCRGQVVVRETGRPVRSRLPAWVQAARAARTGRLREVIRGFVRRRLSGGSGE
ncbi:MAG: radical SAM/SPASM domain-containing protein [Planctomycetota bacterium]